MSSLYQQSERLVMTERIDAGCAKTREQKMQRRYLVDELDVRETSTSIKQGHRAL